jgi:hypothetical protein
MSFESTYSAVRLRLPRQRVSRTDKQKGRTERRADAELLFPHERRPAGEDEIEIA